MPWPAASISLCEHFLSDCADGKMTTPTPATTTCSTITTEPATTQNHSVTIKEPRAAVVHHCVLLSVPPVPSTIAESLPSTYLSAAANSQHEQSQAVQKETEKQQVAANKKYKAKAVLLDEDKARRKQARKAKRIAERLRKLQARAAADNCESTPANDANKQVDPSASAKSKKYRAKDELPPSKVQSDKTFASIAASQDSKANRQQPAPRPGTSDSSVAKKRPEPHITSTAAGQLTSNSQTSPRSSPSAPPASRGGKRGGKGDKQPKFAPKPSAAAS